MSLAFIVLRYPVGRPILGQMGGGVRPRPASITPQRCLKPLYITLYYYYILSNSRGVMGCNGE